MVERDHPSLSLSRQCRLLSIGRSLLYYTPKGESAETLALMRRIDELFLKYPFYGARQMARHLRREGVRIGRRRAARLMRLMGLQAVYRAPRTSDPHPEHRVWPYLLRGLAIERSDHVWCADITYIPVRRGFLYLVAIMDWASRFVLAWRLSNTLDAGFCTDALDEALARYGGPEIFNTDQGSQFTSMAFTGRLQAAGIRISMDRESQVAVDPAGSKQEAEQRAQGRRPGSCAQKALPGGCAEPGIDVSTGDGIQVAGGGTAKPERQEAAEFALIRLDGAGC